MLQHKGKPYGVSHRCLEHIYVKTLKGIQFSGYTYPQKYKNTHTYRTTPDLEMLGENLLILNMD